jgi:hypothetical protein
MNTPGIRYLQINIFVLFIFVLFFAGRCNRGLRTIQDENIRKEAVAKRTKNLIKIIQGIRYTEVRRQFDNGLSFSPVGYQLIPEWKIAFPSLDSVNIYSPRKHKFLNAPVVFDHDSIFDVAWAWLKLKHLSKDSLKFEVLHVSDNIIHDEKVHVYMTFYSNDYLKNVLHRDTALIVAPTRRDTAYVKAKILKANTVLDSAFAGTDPVKLKAKSPLISVEKDTVEQQEINGGASYDQYLLPTFNIVIHKAYDDFNYLYSVFVDENGKLIFRKANQLMMPEFKVSTITAMKGITEGYLKLYLNVTPGKTLGIPHNSIVLLNVSGNKR